MDCSPCPKAIASIVFGFILALFLGQETLATPPNYESFGRQQRITYAPNERDLLRIWVVYVGQGDGILIQLPDRYSYDPDPEDSDDRRSERLDVLIDGGSFKSENATRMRDFLFSLYGPGPITIEYAVITHHDQDHVLGLTRVLESPSISVEAIYHNGLASYRAGSRGFPASGKPAGKGVYEYKSGKVTRGMALLEPDGQRMQADYLVRNLAALRSRHLVNEFQGVYRRLAAALLEKSLPAPISTFDRVWESQKFVDGRESELRRTDLAGLEFEVLWPLERPRKYGDWGETINGNSVTFRLSYGDFQMLFTGDHNEISEEALLEHLATNGSSSGLECDVLKVPHHGSSHAYRPFFDERGCRPIISVASMGEHGAKSKKLQRNAWQHPSTEVISWLGGAHRVYHTLLHERRFKWERLATTADHERLYERSHVLIETDGRWFRMVEVDTGAGSLEPPSVSETRRGDGTRWIKAD